MIEFKCSECSQQIIDISGTNTSGICALCLTIPLWFQHPEIKAIFAPDHDGVEAMDRPLNS